MGHLRVHKIHEKNISSILKYFLTVRHFKNFNTLPSALVATIKNLLTIIVTVVYLKKFTIFAHTGKLKGLELWLRCKIKKGRCIVIEKPTPFAINLETVSRAVRRTIESIKFNRRYFAVSGYVNLHW